MVVACTPIWSSVESFVAAEPDASYEDAEEALIEATWVLNSLTGNRFHNVECRQDEYQSRPGLCRIHLAQHPVDEVFSVTRVDDCTGVETVVTDWCYLSGGTVRICCQPVVNTALPWSARSYPYPHNYEGYPGTCSCDDGIVRVAYRTLSNLPPGASRVSRKLALEFWKSGAGRPCALPERITNVTRQGVSWVLLDPLDFLDKGLTGIASVDQWISAANGRGYASLIDPLINPRLLTTTVTGCTDGCVEPINYTFTITDGVAANSPGEL